MTDKAPFQRVVDELTAGCGCACHTGTGYRSSCEHCHVDGRLANSSGPIAPSMWGEDVGSLAEEVMAQLTMMERDVHALRSSPDRYREDTERLLAWYVSEVEALLNRPGRFEDTP